MDVWNVVTTTVKSPISVDKGCRCFSLGTNGAVGVSSLSSEGGGFNVIEVKDSVAPKSKKRKRFEGPVHHLESCKLVGVTYVVSLCLYVSVYMTPIPDEESSSSGKLCIYNKEADLLHCVDLDACPLEVYSFPESTDLILVYSNGWIELMKLTEEHSTIQSRHMYKPSDVSGSATATYSTASIAHRDNSIVVVFAGIKKQPLRNVDGSSPGASPTEQKSLLGGWWRRTDDGNSGTSSPAGDAVLGHRSVLMCSTLTKKEQQHQSPEGESSHQASGREVSSSSSVTDHQYIREDFSTALLLEALRDTRISNDLRLGLPPPVRELRKLNSSSSGHQPKDSNAFVHAFLSPNAQLLLLHFWTNEALIFILESQTSLTSNPNSSSSPQQPADQQGDPPSTPSGSSPVRRGGSAEHNSWPFKLCTYLLPQVFVDICWRVFTGNRPLIAKRPSLTVSQSFCRGNGNMMMSSRVYSPSRVSSTKPPNSSDSPFQMSESSNLLSPSLLTPPQDGASSPPGKPGTSGCPKNVAADFLSLLDISFGIACLGGTSQSDSFFFVVSITDTKRAAELFNANRCCTAPFTDEMPHWLVAVNFQPKSFLTLGRTRATSMVLPSAVSQNSKHVVTRCIRCTNVKRTSCKMVVSIMNSSSSKWTVVSAKSSGIAEFTHIPKCYVNYVHMCSMICNKEHIAAMQAFRESPTSYSCGVRFLDLLCHSLFRTYKPCESLRQDRKILSIWTEMVTHIKQSAPAIATVTKDDVPDTEELLECIWRLWRFFDRRSEWVLNKANTLVMTFFFLSEKLMELSPTLLTEQLRPVMLALWKLGPFASLGPPIEVPAATQQIDQMASAIPELNELSWQAEGIANLPLGSLPHTASGGGEFTCDYLMRCVFPTLILISAATENLRTMRDLLSVRYWNAPVIQMQQCVGFVKALNPVSVQSVEDMLILIWSIRLDYNTLPEDDVLELMTHGIKLLASVVETHRHTPPPVFFCLLISLCLLEMSPCKLRLPLRRFMASMILSVWKSRAPPPLGPATKDAGLNHLPDCLSLPANIESRLDHFFLISEEHSARQSMDSALGTREEGDDTEESVIRRATSLPMEPISIPELPASYSRKRRPPGGNTSSPEYLSTGPIESPDPADTSEATSELDDYMPEGSQQPRTDSGLYPEVHFADELGDSVFQARRGSTAFHHNLTRPAYEIQEAWTDSVVTPTDLLTLLKNMVDTPVSLKAIILKLEVYFLLFRQCSKVNFLSFSVFQTLKYESILRVFVSSRIPHSLNEKEEGYSFQSYCTRVVQDTDTLLSCVEVLEPSERYAERRKHFWMELIRLPVIPLVTFVDYMHRTTIVQHLEIESDYLSELYERVLLDLLYDVVIPTAKLSADAMFQNVLSTSKMFAVNKLSSNRLKAAINKYCMRYWKSQIFLLRAVANMLNAHIIIRWDSSSCAADLVDALFNSPTADVVPLVNLAKTFHKAEELLDAAQYRHSHLKLAYILQNLYTSNTQTILQQINRGATIQRYTRWEMELVPGSVRRIGLFAEVWALLSAAIAHDQPGEVYDYRVCQPEDFFLFNGLSPIEVWKDLVRRWCEATFVTFRYKIAQCSDLDALFEQLKQIATQIRDSCPRPDLPEGAKLSIWDSTLRKCVESVVNAGDSAFNTLELIDVTITVLDLLGSLSNYLLGPRAVPSLMTLLIIGGIKHLKSGLGESEMPVSRSVIVAATAEHAFGFVRTGLRGLLNGNSDAYNDYLNNAAEGKAVDYHKLYYTSLFRTSRDLITSLNQSSINSILQHTKAYLDWMSEPLADNSFKGQLGHLDGGDLMAALRFALVNAERMPSRELGLVIYDVWVPLCRIRLEFEKVVVWDSSEEKTKVLVQHLFLCEAVIMGRSSNFQDIRKTLSIDASDAPDLVLAKRSISRSYFLYGRILKSMFIAGRLPHLPEGCQGWVPRIFNILRRVSTCLPGTEFVEFLKGVSPVLDSVVPRECQDMLIKMFEAELMRSQMSSTVLEEPDRLPSPFYLNKRFVEFLQKGDMDSWIQGVVNLNNDQMFTNTEMSRLTLVEPMLHSKAELLEKLLDIKPTDRVGRNLIGTSSSESESDDAYSHYDSHHRSSHHGSHHRSHPSHSSSGGGGSSSKHRRKPGATGGYHDAEGDAECHTKNQEEEGPPCCSKEEEQLQSSSSSFDVSSSSMASFDKWESGKCLALLISNHTVDTRAIEMSIAADIIRLQSVSPSLIKSFMLTPLLERWSQEMLNSSGEEAQWFCDVVRAHPFFQIWSLSKSSNGLASNVALLLKEARVDEQICCMWDQLIEICRFVQSYSDCTTTTTPA